MNSYVENCLRTQAPNGLNFNIKWEIAAFRLSQQFFPSALQFSLCILCSFKCTDIRSMKTSSSGYFESKFLWILFWSYLFTQSFSSFVFKSATLNWTNGEIWFYSDYFVTKLLLFIHIISTSIVFIQLHCLLKHTFISMKPYIE